MQETRIQVLGGEGALEKKMATGTSILAYDIAQTEEPGRAAIHGVTKNWT